MKSLDNVLQQQQNNRLRPTMAEMAKATGRPIRYRTNAEGKREPYISLKPGERGGIDRKDWGATNEMVGPWAKAEVERVAKLNGFPGDYGKGLKGKVTLVARGISGEWCEWCDCRKTWCECPPVARAGRDATARRGHGSRRG